MIATSSDLALGKDVQCHEIQSRFPPASHKNMHTSHFVPPSDSHDPGPRMRLKSDLATHLRSITPPLHSGARSGLRISLRTLIVDIDN